MNEITEQSISVLTARQKKFLKGLGHDLPPVILVGKAVKGRRAERRG